MSALKLPPPAMLNIAQELLDLLQDQLPPNARTTWPPSADQAVVDLVQDGHTGLHAWHLLVNARFGIQLPHGTEATDGTVGTVGSLIHAVFRELS